ncbi:MAG TPA: helix-turn-helix domain-containing protein [Candidatus Paceibacterota bacterium]
MTQEETLNILKTGANVFLTGEPGSGKTHTINEYVTYLREHDVEPATTASTGIAATHVGGYTIHSWSGIGIKKYLNEYEYDAIAGKEYVAKKIDRAKVLIIDEISMLDAPTLEAADQVCRLVKRSSKPFGGLQVVLVGDFFQLPPVNRDSERGSGNVNFAFNSKTWQELNPIICYLTEQHRQDDVDFLSVLSAIRKNSILQEHIEILSNRLGLHEEVQYEIPKLFSHNADVDRINQKHLDMIDREDSKTFEMSSQGKDSLVEALKRGCLSPEKLELKVGAVVMFTKNNPASGFVNGTLGEIIDFDMDSGFPIVKLKDGERIEVFPMEWAVEEGGKIKAKIIQVPLRLAWAITIHKSQGMSLDAALIDLSGIFEYGQGYVALSRVKKLSGLYLLGEEIEMGQKAFQVHPEILRKDVELKSLSEEAGKVFGNISESELLKMQSNFVLACGGSLKVNKENTSKKKKKQKAINNGLTTLEETFNLIKEDKRAEEVASIRGLTRQTIISHICQLFEKGNIENDLLYRELSPEATESFDLITSTLRDLGSDKLTPVFHKLSGRYSFDDLKIIRTLSSLY